MASARIQPTTPNDSTYGDAGGSPDYTTLDAWEVDTDIDLVTATAGERLFCRTDGSPYTDSETLNGATTSSSYFRVVCAAAGSEPKGLPGSGPKFISTTGTVLASNEAHAAFYDVVCQVDADSASNLQTVRLNSDNNKAVGVIVDSSINIGSGFARGFILNAGSGATIYFINCLAINCGNDNFRTAGGGTGYMYNCTSVDAGLDGFTRGGGTQILKNCLATGSASDDFAGVWDSASTDNGSSDTSAPGSNPEISLSVSYVNAGADDYHLASGDTAAKDKGADLSADGVFAFDDDADLETITTWSIGFDSQTSSTQSIIPLIQNRLHAPGGLL